MANDSEFNPEFNPELTFSYKFPERMYNYSQRDAALYALGVGVCGADALDDKELKYVYNDNGQEYIQVLPSFATLFSFGFLQDIIQIPGISFDPSLLLHAEQYVQIYKPLPSSGCLQNKASLVGLHDKVKAAIIEVEICSYEKDSCDLLCKNRLTIFLRGAGGFSKSTPPFSHSTHPIDQIAAVKIPKTQPFCVSEDHIHSPQALLYRLCGDFNPLHADPRFAKQAGFCRPILHGLCTLGYAVRAIIKCICKGDPSTVKNISGRFLLHVYPGETLITQMWLQGFRVTYESKVKERSKTVLSGFIELNRLPSSLL